MGPLPPAVSHTQVLSYPCTPMAIWSVLRWVNLSSVPCEAWSDPWGHLHQVQPYHLFLHPADDLNCLNVVSVADDSFPSADADYATAVDVQELVFADVLEVVEISCCMAYHTRKARWPWRSSFRLQNVQSIPGDGSWE